MKGVVVTPFGGEPVPVPALCECRELAGGGRLLCSYCRAKAAIEDNARQEPGGENDGERTDRAE